MLRTTRAHASWCTGGRIGVASRVLRMRFDSEKPPHHKAASSTAATRTHTGDAEHLRPGGERIPPAVEAAFAQLPESMRPKQVAPDFTPFPLPKYDAEMGFGPVRLSDIPDVEVAARRMQTARFMDAEDVEMSDMTAAAMADMMQMTETEGEPASSSSAPAAAGAAPSAVAASSPADTLEDPEDLGDGYAVEEEHFPVLDRLTCRRSTDDLLSQFMRRPAREARTATVLDLANTMETRTDAELQEMLYELGALFTAGGNGLQFLAARVTKFGRAYYAADELMKAFVYFIDAATQTLVEEQPHRLARSPELFVQLLHFLAHIKIFEPNLWYSPNPNSPSNRTDYSHARGVNQTVAHKGTGEELYDYMTMLVVSDENFLLRCSDEQLLDLLAGFGGVMPKGLPEGELANAILDTLLARWQREHRGVLTEVAQVATMERLYLLLNLFNIKKEAILAALLGQPSPTGVTNALKLEGAAAAVPRGPDFFAGAARERQAAVQQRAAELLEQSVTAARQAKDDPLLAALAESGFEFLLSMRDKTAAVSLASRLDWDTLVLRNVPAFDGVARRLSSERALREAQLARTDVTQLSDVQQSLVAHFTRQVATPAGSKTATSSTEPTEASTYVTTLDGKRTHPVRTMLSDLLYLNQMDSLFLLHSSVLGSGVDALLSAVQRLRSGKDALLVTSSCLREVTAMMYYSRTDKQRNNARRALTILAHELEKGRAMLLPPCEELALHDAGTYCDEDLMLWTVAAFMARELPMVRVSTLMSARSRARHPQHHLKGEHSPLAQSTDLYQPDAPLLQSLRSKELRAVTHHANLRRRVRDRPSRLHDINPARARFFYRRDKAMFDKYHVTARHVAPGFSRGALNSDLRGLGYYTPDHPQVPYTPLRQKLAGRASRASAPLPTPRTATVADGDGAAQASTSSVEH